MEYSQETRDKVRKSLRKITKRLEHKKPTYRPQTIKEKRLEDIKCIYDYSYRK